MILNLKRNTNAWKCDDPEFNLCYKLILVYDEAVNFFFIKLGKQNALTHINSKKPLIYRENNYIVLVFCKNISKPYLPFSNQSK